MSTSRLSFLLCAIAVVFSGCGEPERPKPVAVVPKPMPAGGDFDEIGKVSLFQGESCTSQIMFVFRGAGSQSISMAAPYRASKILTDAVHSHKTVHVTGKWRRGKAPGCNYVEATQVEVQRSFWKNN